MDNDLTPETIKTIAAMAAEATDSRELVAINAETGEPGIVSLLTPPAWAREQYDLERIAPHPRRARGVFAFTRAESFAAYVNRHKDDHADSPLLLATDDGSYTCYLDPHGSEPGWHEHVATFALKATPAWKAWQAASGRAMTQAEFAEFLEDRIGEIARPPAAELFELTKTLRVHTDVEFASGQRIDNGQVTLTYNETVNASARGGEVEVPDQLTLVIAPYEGTAPETMIARFRFRSGGGKATFSYVLGEEILRVRAAAVLGATEAIETATGLTALFGTKA